MENQKLGLEPTFPVMSDKVNEEGRSFQEQENGISQRLYIATQICASLVSVFNANSEKQDVEIAYKYADELLSQENL